MLVGRVQPATKAARWAVGQVSGGKLQDMHASFVG